MVQKDDSLLIQNLQDAGCDNELILAFMKLKEQRTLKLQLNLLAKQRKLLLDIVHDHQKKLDCLDYLIYNIKKCGKCP